MARHFLLLSIALMLGVVGCKAQNPDLTTDLPEPNFNGPLVMGPQAPVQTTPRWTPPSATPGRSGLPAEAGWAPGVRPRAWRWIVIHHSATSSGSASQFDRMHREKGWDELGYHFVIGNGAGSGNGRVEIGPRWSKQKWGAHAKTPDNRYNEYGIGICLVGNFDTDRPTSQQMRSLAKLTAYLMQTYHIPPGNVVGHRDTKATECPGRNLNVAQVRGMATQILASVGDTDTSAEAQTAAASSADPDHSGELIHQVR